MLFQDKCTPPSHRERKVRRQKIEDRLCIECNKIEDEFHFMFECQKYKLFRDDLMKVIKDSNMILTDDNKYNLIIVLQTSNILVLKAIGHYLEQCHVT